LRFVVLQLFLLIFFGTVDAAEPVSQLTRYCAVCGLLGVDTSASESGQFIVHAYPPPQFEDRRIQTNITLVKLEPQFLVITAERTKRNFLQELELQDAYRGKVHIYISDRARPEQPLSIVSKMHSDGFEYLVGVPRNVEELKLVKGLVQVLLLELANRNSHRNAELPSWTVEGLTRELLSSITPSFVGNRKPLTIETLGYDRLREARKFFQSNSCLSINELSFSNLSKLAPGSNDLLRYQYSAQLFLHSLLGLRNGSALFTRFIQSLPGTLNWQIAFFEVYKHHFNSPLDLEKWWALTWIDFENRREHEIWPRALSLQKLQATLLTSLDFYASTNALPQTRDVTLPQLLTDVDFDLQKSVLEYKIKQIFFLSFFLSPEAGSLAARYQQIMKKYIDERADAQYRPGTKKTPGVRDEKTIRNAVKEIQQLDAAMAELKAGKLPENLKPSKNRQRAEARR